MIPICSRSIFSSISIRPGTPPGSRPVAGWKPNGFRWLLIACLAGLSWFSCTTTALGQHPPGPAGIAPLLTVVRNIGTAIRQLDDYTCDVESIYFRNGREKDHYRLKFHYRKPNLYRLDFSLPFPGISVFYTDGEETLVAGPSGILTAFRFRFSIDNALVKSPGGQRVDQLSLRFFKDFLLRNIRRVRQDDPAYRETETEVSFRLNALDFVEDKVPERYRIVIARKSWLPLRFARHDADGNLLETTNFTDYRINTGLSRQLFNR